MVRSGLHQAAKGGRDASNPADERDTLDEGLCEIEVHGHGLPEQDTRRGPPALQQQPHVGRLKLQDHRQQHATCPPSHQPPRPLSQWYRVYLPASPKSSPGLSHHPGKDRAGVEIGSGRVGIPKPRGRQPFASQETKTLKSPSRSAERSDPGSSDLMTGTEGAGVHGLLACWSLFTWTC